MTRPTGDPVAIINTSGVQINPALESGGNIASINTKMGVVGTAAFWVNGAAGAGLAVLAAGGGGIKNRIHKMTVVSSATTTLTFSDSIGVITVVAGMAVSIDFSPVGILQGTAATGITVTSADASDVTVAGTYSTE